jgi:hypothetical protein
MLDDVIPEDVDVGALKLSAKGMEGWLLEGAGRLMATRPPPIVVIEVSGRDTSGLFAVSYWVYSADTLSALYS